MTLESLWNTRKLTDEPYNWLTKTAAPPWVIHLARHSYEYAVLEKASVELEGVGVRCPSPSRLGRSAKA
jgi:hypothetical protein